MRLIYKITLPLLFCSSLGIVHAINEPGLSYYAEVTLGKFHRGEQVPEQWFDSIVYNVGDLTDLQIKVKSPNEQDLLNKIEKLFSLRDYPVQEETLTNLLSAYENQDAAGKNLLLILLDKILARS